MCAASCAAPRPPSHLRSWNVFAVVVETPAAAAPLRVCLSARLQPASGLRGDDCSRNRTPTVTIFVLNQLKAKRAAVREQITRPGGRPAGGCGASQSFAPAAVTPVGPVTRTALEEGLGRADRPTTPRHHRPAAGHRWPRARTRYSFHSYRCAPRKSTRNFVNFCG